MGTVVQSPLISVIIPTFNRAAFLESSLESLVNQTIPRDQYEVIVVDDGSTDASQEVCKNFSPRMGLRYFHMGSSGIAAAKNLGIFSSRGSILLFFDDDDVADRQLLEEHLKTHYLHPQENVAVLGHTTWDPMLEVTPVMEWVTEIGQLLFSYGNLTDGQALDFTYLWGGRSSCKKSLLVSHGIFNEDIRFGVEDIELGYRLAKFGLKVVFNRSAVSYMIRPITYDDFCRRCEREGQALFLFSELHRDPVVQEYCQGLVVDPLDKAHIHITNARSIWQRLKQALEKKVLRVREIESSLTPQVKDEEQNSLLQELRSLYWWTFNAFKIKGFVEAMRSRETQRIRSSSGNRVGN